MGKFEIGQWVKVSTRHWKRPNEVGIVKDILTGEKACPYLVVFSKVHPGGGFTDKRFKGQCLRLDETDLERAQ